MKPDEIMLTSVAASGQRSAATLTTPLRFAVCKKQFAKLSKRSADNAALKRLNDINNFDFDGLPYALRYTPTLNRHTLSNLVSASFDRLDQRRNNPLLIYCEPDNPTVHWVELKKLVGVDAGTGQDLNQGTEERLVALSKEIWTKTCTQGQSNTIAEANQPVGADRVTQQGKNLSSSEQAQPSSKEGTALKELYKHYIITSQICEFGFSSDSKLRPLKVKLKDADNLAKAHAVPVESVWSEAVKLAEQDTNYQLAQLYKAMPMGRNERINSTETCDQMSRLLSVSIDAHIDQFSGTSKTIKKDF